MLLNGIVIETPYPRLKYKRKLGSHAVNPHADPKCISEQEDRYMDNYKELVSMV